jgi:hypothetical protein
LSEKIPRPLVSEGFRKFFVDNNEPYNEWTKTSNVLIDELYPHKVSGALQMALVLLIARRTWGADKKPNEYTRLTLREVAAKLGCSVQALVTAIEDAEKRGLIESKNFGGHRAKRYRLTRWADVPKYERPPATQTTFTIFDSGSELFPGRHSRPIQLRLFPRDKERDFLDVQVYNRLNQRVAYALNYTDDGLIVTVLAAQPTSSPLEHQIAVSSPVVVENNSIFEKAPEIPQNGKTPRQRPFQFPLKKRPEPPHAPVGSEPTSLPSNFQRDWNLGEQMSYYRPCVSRVLLDHWGKALDETFLDTIVTKADGAHVDLFASLVHQRIAADPERKLRTGILIVLAEDAARSHRAIKARDENQPPKQQEMTKEEYRAWALTLPAEDYAALVNRGEVDR